MYAKKVDLGALEDIGTNAEGDGNARYEGHELTGFGSPNPNVPFFTPPGRFESPGTGLDIATCSC